MSDFFFWAKWNKQDRIFVTVFFIFFCLAALYLVYGYFYGLSNIISWETRKDLVPVPLGNLLFDSGTLRISLPVDQYLVFQYYEGSILKINPVFWSVYLVFFIISINLVLALLTSLTRFWFYGAMGAFIGFIILIQPDHIMLFGSTDKSGSILLMSIFLSISYIIREFRPWMTLLNRFLVFFAASAVAGVIIYFYAGVPHPFIYMVSYGITAPILVSFIFILTISHEIIYAFLYIASGSVRTGSTKSILHFTILTIVYLFYVFITFLSNTKRIDWNLVYLNPIIILLISAFTGFWWLGKREHLFDEILPFRPTAALFFLAIGAMSLSTYGFILSVGNDPLAETYEDFVIYAQIGFGIMFFIYVIANFGTMMAKGINVLPVTYKSRTIPFFVFRLGGLMVAGFMLLQSGFFPFFQAKAGYYNLVGDLFWQENQTPLAGEYYLKASQYESQNHRSNYALASIAKLKNNKADQIYYLENANLKQPSPYSYINVSNIFLENGQFFEGLFKLTEGYKVFPGSSRINNNLGYFYSKTDIYDSSYYFFNHARAINPRLDEVKSNQYALIAKAKVNMNFDSVTRELGKPHSIVAFANMTALANDLGRKVDFPEKYSLSDSISSPEEFAFLYNKSLNMLQSGDTAYFSELLSSAGKARGNYYPDRLKLVAALGFYGCHQAGKTFRLLDETAASGENRNYYSIMGNLYLISNDPQSAIVQYEKLLPLIDPLENLYYGIALLASGKIDSSSIVFNNLIKSRVREVSILAGEYSSLLKHSGFQDSLSDEIKYNLLRYRLKDINTDSFKELIRSIKSPAIRDLARLEKAELNLNSGNPAEAKGLWKDVENTNPEEGTLKNKIEKLDLLLWVYDHEDSMSSMAMNYIEVPVKHPNYLEYTLKNAVIAVSKKDTISADHFFDILSAWDPFFEAGILRSVIYYNQYKNDIFHGYHILYDALEINRYSISLNKEFVIQCIKLNLVDYARDSMRILKDLLNKEDFDKFTGQINARIRESRARADDWSRQ